MHVSRSVLASRSSAARGSGSATPSGLSQFGVNLDHAQARRVVVAAALASQRGRVRLRAGGRDRAVRGPQRDRAQARRRRRLEGQQRQRPLPDQSHASRTRSISRSAPGRRRRPRSIPTSTCGSSATRTARAICTRPASPIRRGRHEPHAEDRPLQNPVRQQSRPIRRSSRPSSPAARSRGSATPWG